MLVFAFDQPIHIHHTIQLQHLCFHRRCQYCCCCLRFVVGISPHEHLCPRKWFHYKWDNVYHQHPPFVSVFLPEKQLTMKRWNDVQFGVYGGLLYLQSSLPVVFYLLICAPCGFRIGRLWITGWRTARYVFVVGRNFFATIASVMDLL